MELKTGTQSVRRLKLRHALARVRKAYQDEVASEIVNDTEHKLSYEQIGKRWGVSTQFVKDTAAARGIGRKRLDQEDAEVVVNG